jgi:hypothetical protein
MSSSVRSAALSVGQVLLTLFWLVLSAQAASAGPFGRSNAYAMVALIPGLIAIWYPGLSLRDRGFVAATGIASGAGVLLVAYLAAVSADSIHTQAFTYGYLSTASWSVAWIASIVMARRATPGQRRFLQRFGL